MVVYSQPNGGSSRNVESSDTPKMNRESPEKIFDPKPPSFATTMHSRSAATKQNRPSTDMMTQQNQLGGQQVQNVFQFNLRVSNGAIQGGNIVVDQQPQQ